jgi:pimeloyl-ACP methyl ester carboxylesterase
MLITLGNYRISYEASGRGIPVLLMHAFPLHQGMFEQQRAALADVARLLTFDVPGVGESAPAEVSIDDIADIAVALLDALKIERAVVGGVSMGGYAAFSFARRNPGRLRGLILANTRAVGDSEEAKKGRREMAALALAQGPAEIAKRMLLRLLGETTHRERQAVVERARRIAESVPAETIAGLLEALANRADSTDLLPRISVPALVIAGEQDPIAPAAEASEWSRQIRSARFVSIAGAGHLPNLETPQEFNEAVQEFLESLPR